MSRKILWLVIKGIISLTAILFILNRINLDEFAKVFFSASLPLFLLAFLFAVFVWVINTHKWQLLLLTLEVRYNFNKLLKLNFVALYYSLFLPGQVSGEVVKGLKLIRANKEDAHNILTSILMDRITGLFTLVLIALLGLVVASSPGADHQLKLLVVIVLLGLTLFFLLILNNRIAVLLKRLNLPVFMTANLRRHLYLTWEAFRSYKKDLSSLGKVFGYSLLFQLLATFINYLVCLSVGVAISFLALLWIVATVSLLQMLPISISGIGVREGLFVFLFGQYGVCAPEALAVSIMIFAIQVLSGLIGGILEFTGGGERYLEIEVSP